MGAKIFKAAKNCVSTPKCNIVWSARSLTLREIFKPKSQHCILSFKCFSFYLLAAEIFKMRGLGTRCFWELHSKITTDLIPMSVRN